MKKLPIFTSLVFLVAAIAWLVYATGLHEKLNHQFNRKEVKKNEKSGTVGFKEKENPEGDQAKVPKNDDAQKLLRKAQVILTQYSSLRAKFREVIQKGNQKFNIEGTYLQGDSMQLRMECNMQAGDTKGRMIQVCDGHLLWTELQLGKIPPNTPPEKRGQYLRITRRNVDKILNEAENIGGANDPRIFLTAELATGGLPALLASLDTSMNFIDLGTDQIQEQKYRVLEGTWNQANQKRWDLARKKFNKGNYPTIPDQVRIYLEPQTLFPSRIIYLKKHTSNKKNKAIPLMAIQFYDVVTNATIAPEQFVYIPPEGVPPKDVTHKFIRTLRNLKK